MKVRVSAVQLEFEYASTPQELYDSLAGPLELAAKAGSQIVAFPNYAGLLLLGAAVPAADVRLSLLEIAQRGGYSSTLEMLQDVAPTLWDLNLHLFSSLASRYGVYLASGTAIQAQEDSLYNTACLFSPTGSLLGEQRQTHRSSREVAWGLQQGSTLAVFDIGIARIGFVVGTDVEYPEVARILSLQNANLLIHPAAYRNWPPEHHLIDLWRDAQSNQVFGLQCCAVGQYKGRSAVYAPVEMTSGEKGWIEKAASDDRPEVVSAELDFDRLQQVIDGYPVFDYFNLEFYSQEFPQIYG